MLQLPLLLIFDRRIVRPSRPSRTCRFGHYAGRRPIDYIENQLVKVARHKCIQNERFDVFVKDLLVLVSRMYSHKDVLSRVRTATELQVCTEDVFVFIPRKPKYDTVASIQMLQLPRKLRRCLHRVSVVLVGSFEQSSDRFQSDLRGL